MMAVVAVFGIALSSCVSVLGLEGYGSAIAALCDMHNGTCKGSYPDCTSRAEKRLTNADEAVRAGWLVNFVDNRCLDQCLENWNCLDSTPICGARGSSCNVAEECCGFSSTTADCQGGRCCTLDGRRMRRGCRMLRWQVPRRALRRTLRARWWCVRARRRVLRRAALRSRQSDVCGLLARVRQLRGHRRVLRGRLPGQHVCDAVRGRGRSLRWWQRRMLR